MSINKHVDDHNTTEIAQVSIRDQFRPCSRDSSGGRTTRKLICYGSPPRGVISLVPLWFPRWFL